MRLDPSAHKILHGVAQKKRAAPADDASAEWEILN
jgi:hypothetical protein